MKQKKEGDWGVSRINLNEYNLAPDGRLRRLFRRCGELCRFGEPLGAGGAVVVILEGRVMIDTGLRPLL